MHTSLSKLVALSVEKYHMVLTEIQLKICRFHGSLSQKVPDPWSNSKFRPEKPEIISISLTLTCLILKSLFRFNLTCYMSWWRWMVSDSNKFVLIRSEGRVSIGKQLVLRTASTYQLLVKAPSWLHWDWLLKWWGCTANTRCSVIVGMQISSFKGPQYSRRGCSH